MAFHILARSHAVDSPAFSLKTKQIWESVLKVRVGVCVFCGGGSAAAVNDLIKAESVTFKTEEKI